MAQNFGQELLINGNFSQNNCLKIWCIFNTTNEVNGWIPESEIEIGDGNYYKGSTLGTGKAIELAPHSNGCIRQTVTDLTPGIYRLKYFYAARDGIVFENSRFIVKFNTKQFREITPVDYNINLDTIEIGIYDSSVGDVRFCSTGIFNDGTGGILTLVSLVKSRGLPIQSEVFNPSRIILDSHSEKVFEKEYELDNGPIEISFDYLLVATFLVTKSTVVVKFDGQEVFKVRTCQSDNNIKISVPKKLLKGVYNVSFHTIGSPEEGPHKILISNVIVKQTQCLLETKNLIVNGNFSDNQCTSNFCTWNQTTIGNNIPGWIPKPQIQIGKISVYSSLFDSVSSWLSELDVNANTCIRQNITLKPGRHSVKFHYAARKINLLNSSWIEVRLNQNRIDLVKPIDYQLHTETINLELMDVQENSFIDFCGAGTSDASGPLISNIQMFGYYRCTSTKIVSF